MKIRVKKADDGWRWALLGANNKVIASGEAYQRPQKLVQTIERFIIRGDEQIREQFVLELMKHGLDPEGKQLRVPKETPDGMKWEDPR